MLYEHGFCVHHRRRYSETCGKHFCCVWVFVFISCFIMHKQLRPSIQVFRLLIATSMLGLRQSTIEGDDAGLLDGLYNDDLALVARLVQQVLEVLH